MAISIASAMSLPDTRAAQNVPAKVATVEYDPNRSARISLLHYLDGEKRYILTPTGLEVGDEIGVFDSNGVLESCIPEFGCNPNTDTQYGEILVGLTLIKI